MLDAITSGFLEVLQQCVVHLGAAFGFPVSDRGLHRCALLLTIFMQLRFQRCHHLLNCLSARSRGFSDRRHDVQRRRAVRVAGQLASHCLPYAFAWALLQLCFRRIAVDHGWRSTEVLARLTPTKHATMATAFAVLSCLAQFTINCAKSAKKLAQFRKWRQNANRTAPTRPCHLTPHCS